MQLQGCAAGAAIGRVADDGRAEQGAMRAKLVGATGARPELQPGAAPNGWLAAVPRIR